MKSQVLWLFHLFEQHHFEIYLVGGCVRDQILKRPVHDYDFTSNATPQEMITLLENEPCKVILTGAKHGTVTVIYQEEQMEITTYRSDGVYEQHRKPKQVRFSDDLLSDLKRRDFTMNAIAYHPRFGYIDPFHGIQDCQKQRIRCVGNAKERFEEDALRILRAIRFSFQLGFTLESDCLDAIRKQAHLLSFISKERIKDEFNKMLMSDAKHTLSRLRDAQVLPYIIPTYSMIDHITQESKWHNYDVFTHTDIALNHSIDYTLEEKIAIVFHDIGKAKCKTFDEFGVAHFYKHPVVSAEIAKASLQHLKYSNKIIQKVCTLISYHDYHVLPKQKILRRFLAKLDMNFSMAYAILNVQYADDCAKSKEMAQALLNNIEKCVAVLKEMEHNKPSRRCDMAVNGHDMIALGFQGKEIKNVLDYLYAWIIDEPLRNQKDLLLKQAMIFKNSIQ